MEGALHASDDPIGGSPAVGVVFMVVGLALLLLVAGCGRVSGLGPVLAGAVWGVVPALAHELTPDLFLEISGQFDEIYGDWVVEFGLAVFPLVAALLIGAGIAGRWSRTES